MKSNMLIAIALLSLAGLAVPARAQEAKVVVTVPFGFIAGTQALPAGKYIVSTVGTPGDSLLLLSSRDHGAFVLPATFDSTQLADTSLKFLQIGDEHVLSQIQTLDGAYTIDNRRKAQRLTKLAQSNDHTAANGMTSSGGQ